MELDVNNMMIIGGVLLSSGAAWGGSKVALNGTKQRVKDLETTQLLTVQRLSSIEAKIDLILKR